MLVKNRGCIRRLSLRTLRASRKRDLIAVFAIALTTLLFTALFTIMLSLNATYETYQFRQVGGCAHGTFKSVSTEQQAAIAAHPQVKAVGARTVIGINAEGVFSDTAAEVSWMDENCTKWSYAVPSVGRMSERENEVAMDTEALRLLGAEAKLGAQIPISFEVTDKDQTGETVEHTFTLVGYWPYDNLMPVHYINVSKAYTERIEQESIAAGLNSFRTDLNVMLPTAIDIRGQMEMIDTDLGYTWDSWSGENAVRIGVNWGYTASQAGASMDTGTIAAIAVFLILVMLTGYLIIYNIFLISVTGDIRFYGLLKTIGTTPRQLRRVIRQQALALCLFGIPLGLLLGFGVGVLLTPIVLNSLDIGSSAFTVSTSPIIFLGSSLFALLTVLLSCARPGRLAGRVSPVEAVKYTEASTARRKSRRARGAKLYHMAYANLGRSRSKTVLVIVSLALSVTLLNQLCGFVNGFNTETYLSHQICADFIVRTPKNNGIDSGTLSEKQVAEIRQNTVQSLGGCVYTTELLPQAWVPETFYRSDAERYLSPEAAEQQIRLLSRRGDRVATNLLLAGLDDALLEKLTVVEGSLEALGDPCRKSIAVVVPTDDYGRIKRRADYPAIGDTLPVDYISDGWYIDTRTGEKCTADTPEEYLQYHAERALQTEYTVCALVIMPYSMGYRYGQMGSYEAVVSAAALQRDSGTALPMAYLFDTPDNAAEEQDEQYLNAMTAADSSIQLESKATVRASFDQFRRMFSLLGGVLCGIIGVVGVLNFMNAMLTGIMTRRREFAMLQAVGMTGRQLQTLLMYEGLFYAVGSIAAALLFAVSLGPLFGRLLGNLFWFFDYRFTVLPVLLMLPLFVLLGIFVPWISYRSIAGQTVVERLCEIE